MKILKIKEEQFHWSDVCRAMKTFCIKYCWMRFYDKYINERRLFEFGFNIKDILIIDFEKVGYLRFTRFQFYENMIIENMTDKEFLSILDRYKKLQCFK